MWTENVSMRLFLPSLSRRHRSLSTDPSFARRWLSSRRRSSCRKQCAAGGTFHSTREPHESCRMVVMQSKPSAISLLGGVFDWANGAALIFVGSVVNDRSWGSELLDPGQLPARDTVLRFADRTQNFPTSTTP
jgi:hypothetical protein